MDGPADVSDGEMEQVVRTGWNLMVGEEVETIAGGEDEGPRLGDGRRKVAALSPMSNEFASLSVVVVVPRQSVSTMVGQIFEPVSEGLGLEEYLDGLGEFANIIAGNLRRSLSEEYLASTPFASTGSDLRPLMCGQEVVYEGAFRSEKGAFRVYLLSGESMWSA